VTVDGAAGIRGDARGQDDRQKGAAQCHSSSRYPTLFRQGRKTSTTPGSAATATKRSPAGKRRKSLRRKAPRSRYGTVTSRGRNLTLEPGRRIVQSWRTTKFTAADADSQIEVVLQPATGGTTVTVRHSNVPDGHTSYRDGGWQRSYFEPMKQHFKRAR